jgi:signal transduction histidine kinase
LFIRDGTESLRVHTPQTNHVRPGDLVEVVGFAEPGRSGPILEGAAFRRLGSGQPVLPLTLASKDLLGTGRDSDLVQIQARLISLGREPRKSILVLQAGDSIVSAELEDGTWTGKRPLPEPGSVLQLLGIQLVDLDEFFKLPRSFRLLLRSPEDIRVLQSPPWWNLGRALNILSILGVGLLGALLWIKLLRRQVEERTQKLREEIEERKRMELEVENVHEKLIQAARRAGMAEVATSVLHNVGNVLNSVNVSATMVHERLRHLRVHSLAKAAAMIDEQAHDLPGFLTQDPKGKRFPEFLRTLAQALLQEQQDLQAEAGGLRKNIEHIKVIVGMQQSYARVGGALELLHLNEVMEDALQIEGNAYDRDQIQLVRQYHPVPQILADRHKILHILVNLLTNARYALESNPKGHRQVSLSISLAAAGRVCLAVHDNGVGIEPQHLNRIFNQGFTTRKNGHGFGLHSGALTAKEMNGSLTAHSDGPGKGAVFTLELPIAGRN